MNRLIYTEDEAIKQADIYTAQGYRCISRITRTIARIDKPDWHVKLKWDLNLAMLSDADIKENWANYYRRNITTDILTNIQPNVCILVPDSSYDSTGYVDLENTAKVKIILEGEYNMMIEAKCPFCGAKNTVTVVKKQYDDWQNGTLIQTAMPNVTPDDRELLMTGICKVCFP